MRYRPARYQNGYHRTLTTAQERNRWGLYLGLLLMLMMTSRCSGWWGPAHEEPKPAPMGKLV
jgi:hypothetical protein